MKLLMENWRKFLKENAEQYFEPGSFKAIFMAGGSGTGKSVTLERLNLQEFGMNLINPDTHFEKFLKDAGLPLDITSHEGEEKKQSCRLFNDAMKQAQSDRESLAAERKGIIVDGTGGALHKIKNPNKDLKALGYDTAIIFLNADVETVLRRAGERTRMGGRKLKPEKTERSHNAVQRNKEIYKEMFGENFFEIEVSGNEQDDQVRQDIEERVDEARERIVSFILANPTSPIAPQLMRCAPPEEEVPMEEQSEPYQQSVKKGSVKRKKRLIGKGGNKTKAAPFDKNPSMKRSKSAPPGAGGE